jgi:VanZ family protein
MSKILRCWKTETWSLIMLFLFLLPEKDLSRAPSIPGISQFFHVTLFAGFSLFVIWDLSRIKSLAVPSRGIYLISIGLSVLYGTVIEFLQAVSNLGRHAEILDVVFDLAGSVLAVLMVRLYFRSRRPTG